MTETSTPRRGSRKRAGADTFIATPVGKSGSTAAGPTPSNTISALAVLDGKLYAGSERYSGAGSSLPVSPNTEPGGKVYRYEGGAAWTDCGKVDEGVVSISGLATFNGQLYAGTGTTGSEHPMPRTKGMYRYEGGTKWVSCGCPGKRIVHLGVYNGHLYGLSYDGGNVFRYDGDAKWTDLGVPPETNQSYSFMVYEGKMHVATWPKALVFRFDDAPGWTSIGRLGDEKEAMAVSIYNGSLYVGTLPLAEVYRHDGGTTWTSTGRLDLTPDVVYRRAWSMAVFQGRLYCGLLPSGKVFSLEAGKCVTLDRELPPGWQHLAAVKSGDRLKLYVNGQCVATSSAFDPASLNLSNDQPLRIGFGRHDYFNGKIRDLRIYRSALDDADVRATPARDPAAGCHCWLAQQCRGDTSPIAFRRASLHLERVRRLLRLDVGDRGGDRKGHFHRALAGGLDLEFLGEGPDRLFAFDPAADDVLGVELCRAGDLRLDVPAGNGLARQADELILPDGKRRIILGNDDHALGRPRPWGKRARQSPTQRPGQFVSSHGLPVKSTWYHSGQTLAGHESIA